MNRIDRLFGILTLLQSRKFVTAETIAEKFGISIRTVYRDVKAIGESGVPVCFEPHKGYCILPGYFLPPVSFSSDEANALLIVESIIQGFSDKSIKKHYSSALGKVKSVLKNTQKEQVEQLQNNIMWQLPSCFVNDYEHLSLIQNAVATKSALLLEYMNREETGSRREVEPIGLIFYAMNWHLIAWCHKRHDYRDFRVSRIRSLKLSGHSFEKAEHMSLSEYMKQVPVDY